MSFQSWAEWIQSGHRPVSVHGTHEFWEVGVHGCRHPPGFQHTLAVKLGWVPATRTRAIFNVYKVWAYMSVYRCSMCFTQVIAQVFFFCVLADIEHFLSCLVQ